MPLTMRTANLFYGRLCTCCAPSPYSTSIPYTTVLAQSKYQLRMTVNAVGKQFDSVASEWLVPLLAALLGCALAARLTNIADRRLGISLETEIGRAVADAIVGPRDVLMMLMWQVLMHTQNKAQQAIRLELWLLVIYLVVYIRFKKVTLAIGLLPIALFQKIGTVVAIRDTTQFEPRRSDELEDESL
ncbi:hypothetical protein RB195_005040 [Necator americanus]|uniref:Uncharacterized protein n=1 Tax=Necator americanus TaxID=51031 RepID=A0ABR1BKX7_NECAM